MSEKDTQEIVQSFYRSNNKSRFETRGSMDDLGSDYSELIDNFLSVVPDGNILDAGCGVGRDARYMREAGRNVISLDLSREQLQFATENPVQGDLSQLPIESESVAGVWAPSSVFFIPRRKIPSAIGELSRVVENTGICSIGFKVGPRTEQATMERYGETVPFQRFTESDAVEVVQNQGFAVTEKHISEVGDRTFLHLLVR